MFFKLLFGNPLTFVAIVHAYVGWQLVPAFAFSPLAQVAFTGYLVLSFALIPLAMRVRSMRDPSRGDQIAWAGFLAMGLFSSLFVLTLLRNIGLAVTSLAFQHPGASLRHYSAAAVPALALFASVAGLLSARRGARVEEVDIPIAGLDPAWEGFSIVQISDIHVGATIKRGFVTAIVDKVNELQPDMVAVTGDVVDGSVAQLSTHTQPLAELKSRHGTYFVTGNHEYYSGATAWIDEFRRLGMTVLNNEHRVLRRGAASLIIAGVTDEGSASFEPSHKSDPIQALAGAPADARVKILLAHRPGSAAAAQTAGFTLQLSGHTHGGQFWPWNLFVGFFNPFAVGLHRLRDLWVYVNRGTGYWGPPKRFGVPAEITRLRLVTAAP